MKKTISYLSAALSTLILLSSCGNNQNTSTSDMDSTKTSTHVLQSDFGETDGKKVSLFTLTNNKGTQVTITNYGATITSFVTADKTGAKNSIVLGFNKLGGYLAKPPYFGATIGRYGNRIGKATFKLDGTTYKLKANNGANHLHGGEKGFDKVVWDIAPLIDSASSVTLNYVSKDGEEGYPGNLKVGVTFTLTNDNELKIDYTAETDKPTVLNLTNHSYFNLTGNVENTILNHVLMIDADKYTPVDDGLIPTGELKPVAGTLFDFTKPTKIGARIGSVAGGYDHNFVLNKTDKALTLVASVTDSTSGRKLEVYTKEPGLQFYTGNFLDGKLKTDDGKPINKNAAFCLETQHFPDSPNKPAFPSVILRPGEKYETTTTYKVSLLP